MINFDYFSSLDFQVVKSPSSQYNIYDLPDGVEYTEFDEISIAFVQNFPPQFKEFVGRCLTEDHTFHGMFERLSGYWIQPLGIHADVFMITKYINHC